MRKLVGCERNVCANIDFYYIIFVNIFFFSNIPYSRKLSLKEKYLVCKKKIVHEK